MAPLLDHPGRADDGLGRWSKARRFGEMVLTAVAVAAPIAVAATYVPGIVTGQMPQFTDLGWLLQGGSAGLHGQNPYTAFTPTVAASFGGFTYPPLVAWVMGPLAALSEPVAAVLWLIATVAATLAACVVVANGVLPAHWPRARLAILGAFLYPAATSNYWNGQINPIVFLLLALALRAYMSEQNMRSALWIGIAAAIKLAPIVLVVLLLRRRWWRASAIAIAVFVGSLALGGALVSFTALHDWVVNVLPYFSRATAWLQIQSWNSVVSRITGETVFGSVPNRVVATVAMALSATGILFAAWVVRPEDQPASTRAAEFAVGVAAMLLATSFAWSAQYVFILPLLAAAAAWLRRGDRVDVPLALALAAALSGTVVIFVLLQQFNQPFALRQSHEVWWGAFVQLTSLPALSVGALALVLGLRVRAAASAEAPA